MSGLITGWVWDSIPAKNAGERTLKYVLLCHADGVADDGRGSSRTPATIARRTGLSAGHISFRLNPALEVAQLLTIHRDVWPYTYDVRPVVEGRLPQLGDNWGKRALEEVERFRGLRANPGGSSRVLGGEFARFGGGVRAFWGGSSRVWTRDKQKNVKRSNVRRAIRKREEGEEAAPPSHGAAASPTSLKVNEIAGSLWKPADETTTKEGTEDAQ